MWVIWEFNGVGKQFKTLDELKFHTLDSGMGVTSLY